MRARSAILELLSVQTAEELVTPAGKSAIKKAICERVSPLTGGVQVTIEVTFEVEGSSKPSCVAEVIFRYYA